MPAPADRPVRINTPGFRLKQVNGLAEENRDVFHVRSSGFAVQMVCHALPLPPYPLRLTVFIPHSALRTRVHSPRGRFVAGFDTPKLLAAWCGVSNTWNASSPPVVRKIFFI